MTADHVLTAAFVVLGAGAGTACRFLIGASVVRGPHALQRFPYATLLVNLLGSFLLGVLVGLFSTPVVGAAYVLALVSTGFCGAFTTMSAFSLELLALLHHRRYVAAAVYLVVSVVGGVLLVLVGSRAVLQLM